MKELDKSIDRLTATYTYSEILRSLAAHADEVAATGLYSTAHLRLAAKLFRSFAKRMGKETGY